MKNCPACNRTFSDDTLTYCLADGTLLSAPYEPSAQYDPEATQRLNLSNVTNQTKTEVLHYSPSGAHTVAPAKNPLIKYVVIAVLALALGGGTVMWFNSGGRETASNDSQSNSAPTPAGSRLGITATASSERSPESGVTYRPGNVIDQSLDTAWDEGVDGPGIGEWVRCDFDREVKLNRIIITPGYFKGPSIWRMNNRLAAATFYFSDGSSRAFNFPDRMSEQRLEVGGIRTRWVRMVINEIHPGSADTQDTPISNLAFDWE